MPSRTPTILIIDNDDGLVAALRVRLESMGYRCRGASTGAQGIAAFLEHDVDLVISDLNMPGGDGVGLARNVRARSDVPIIIITGFRDEFRRELRAIPRVTTLQKPFAFEALRDLVEAELLVSGQSLPV
ncbi:MAG: response regulator [Phycisphaerales bacterium]